VFGLSTAPFAPFFELYFAFYKFSVLARPIVNAAAFGARELYELIL
jgi:hypothetical protein